MNTGIRETQAQTSDGVDFDCSASRNSPKSLRRLARELGVSASYLSQVKNGKCAASARLLNALSKIEASGETSNPLGGTTGVSGGFDSHALPPVPA
jgi:transcriptional regulator with XRE-family HTH domain